MITLNAVEARMRRQKIVQRFGEHYLHKEDIKEKIPYLAKYKDEQFLFGIYETPTKWTILSVGFLFAAYDDEPFSLEITEHADRIHDSVNYVGGKAKRRIISDESYIVLDDGLGRAKFNVAPKIPVGLSRGQFNDISKVLRNELGGISNDIVIQGSRASGRARILSDLDIGVKVSPERFDQLIAQQFHDGANRNTLSRKASSIRDERIFASDAGIKHVRNKVADALGVNRKVANQQIQVTIIKQGGLFDNGVQIPIK